MTSLEFESCLSNATTSLRPIAMRFTKDSEESNDLIQRTLMKAWVNKHRFNPSTNLKAWLYTIMKNTFLSDYRKNKRHQTFIDSTDTHFYINSFSNSGGTLSTDANLDVKEIYQTISALPDQLRLPFELYLQGYKYKEISKSLSLPLGTVKHRIFLSRKELKQKLQYLFQISG